MLLTLSLLAVGAFAQASFQPCPILGPAFVPPKCISSTEDVWAHLRGNLTAAALTRDSPFGNLTVNTTYSFQVFSLDKPDPLFEWHLTPEIIKNGRFGVKEVDSNTIYRVGSVSKLISVYTILASLGTGYWDRPVTDFIPELRGAAESHRADSINFVQWDQVTLGSLASHLSGVVRDFERSGLDLEFQSSADQIAAGFPPLSPSEIPACRLNATDACTRSQFFANIDTRQPIYAVSTTPIYSNTAWGILGYAVESITGIPFSDLVQQTLISPLNLTSTTYSTPLNSSRSLIPTSPDASFYNVNLESSSPAGNMYSSANDLARLARSILSSSLLPPNTTRAWLKPTSLTSDTLSAIGRPWEIYRTVLPSTNRLTDAYTKSGELGAYTANLVLYPDYNIGWVGLAARPNFAAQGDAYELDAFAANLIPQAMEELARRQTQENIAGTYRSSALNSSVVLSTSPDQPGLVLTSLISNSTDIYGGQLDSGALAVRLYPTDLSEVNPETGLTEMAFRSVGQRTAERFSSPWLRCFTWFSVDAQTYGSHAQDQWVVEMDERGRAVAVRPRWLAVRLERV